MNKCIILTLIIISFSGLAHSKSEKTKEDSKSEQVISEENELKKTFPAEKISIKINRNGYALEIDFTPGETIELPVTLYYEGKSCAISCITNQAPNQPFVVSDKGNIIGFIKIKGTYHNNNCIPYGIEPGSDISKIEDFPLLCYKFYPENYKSSNSVIISSDTGKFFNKKQ